MTARSALTTSKTELPMGPVFSWEMEDQRQRACSPIRFDPDVDGMVLSDRGGREENQDAWGYAQADDGSVLLTLADGLGGHAGGRAAAQAAVRGCLEAALGKPFDGLGEQALADMFMAAHQSILAVQAKRPEFSSMRSTLLVLIIKDYQLRWGHIGDVRLYLARGGAMLQRTRDQSVPQMLVDAGRLQESEIRSHPDRNRLLQTLGQNEQAPHPDLAGTASFEPADFLLLASDGFWEWIDEEDMLRAAAQNAPREALGKAEEKLRGQAPARDAEFDNYSAIFLGRAPRAGAKGVNNFFRFLAGQ
jgi:serine/threonine protein phosphatase PrpC